VDRFEAFAEFRIRGAMLDDLRSRDTLSRDMRRLSNELRDATRRLESQLGRTPDQEEIARRLGVGVDELYARQQKLSGSSVVGIDDAGPDLLERTGDHDPNANIGNLDTTENNLKCCSGHCVATISDPLNCGSCGDNVCSPLGTTANVTLAVQAVSMGLAGTDLVQHRDFVRAAEEHRRTEIQIINESAAESRTRAGSGTCAGVSASTASRFSANSLDAGGGFLHLASRFGEVFACAQLLKNTP
jgi:hypothetical protein